MTEVTFLGTADDLSLVAKGIRNAASVMLSYNNSQILINPSVNILASCVSAKQSIRATSAVLCTSPSLVVSHDITVAVCAMTLSGEDVHGVLIAPESVLSGTEKTPSLLLPTVKHYLERIISVAPEKKCGIDEIDITTREIQDGHGGVGYKLYFPDVTIGYCPTTAYSVRTVNQFKGCDLLILHVSHARGSKSRHTLSTEHALEFAKRIKPSLLVLTGFGKSMLEADPIQEARFISKESGVQTMVAVDGQTISPGSYSAKGKQKQLKTFSSE